MDGSFSMKKPYQDLEEKVYFPMIRLGNNLEMIEAIKKLREILNFVSQHEKSVISERRTDLSKNESLSSFKELKELLLDYENQVDLKDRLDSLIKIRNMTKIEQINHKLDSQIEMYKEKIRNSREIKDEDVLKYAISASDDKNFQNYVYYSSLAKFKKLSNDTYRELREIVYIEGAEEAAKELNRYLKDDTNLRRFLQVFPIVICTNLSCEKLGTPKPQFDIVIMDEAGQCNIATSLIPIVRGQNLVLVGDTNQLQPVTVIEENVNDDLLHKYGVSLEYDYVHNSILSTMLRKDNNSKNILLRYHYRCGKKI